MEDIMALVIIFMLLGFGGSVLGIVSTVFKKIIRAITGDSKAAPQRRVEPLYRQVRSTGAEQQLSQTMKHAVQNAASRGEAWAQTIINYSAPAATQPTVNIPVVQPQGQHEPLQPSEEGTYPAGVQEEHEQSQADSCRAVTPTLGSAMPVEDVIGRRAVRKSGSVTGQRAAHSALSLTPQSVQQGIIWREILNRRGGRGNIH